MRPSVALRTRILSSVLIFVALLLVVRLYFVQIVHGQNYRKNAESQYVAPNSDTEARGSIFFTSKDDELVAAAVMQSGWRIALQPDDIVDPEQTYSVVNAVSPVTHDSFVASAAKKGDPYEEVAVHLDDETAASIRAKKIPGVLLVADQWRFYPAHELGASVVGFVGYTGDTREGVYGLERFYQDTLSTATAGLYVNPFAEIFANIESLLSFNPSEYKGDIITSIEPSVQRRLETTLEQVMKIDTPEFAGGIVMDPHTGEIVAMANRPTFDPNTYGRETDNAVYANRLVEGRYELGSIMKPLTMAAGLDNGAIKPTSTYNDKGCIELSTYEICNFDLKPRGVIPMQEILNQSLNIGAAYIAQTMGYPDFTLYMKTYGFGERTKIDLPNEVVGDISPLGDGQKPAINYATAAYGQGIAVSPIEMIRALSALANHGELPTPHVVTGVRYESGITRKIVPAPGPIVLKPETAETVTSMLIKVVDTGLLHGELKQEHYTIAAKTGTAQIPKPGGGYHPPGTYLHSFFGYFPAHDPKFIIFLFAYKPHGQQYASATLARPFMDIAKYLINYYNIAPDR